MRVVWFKRDLRLTDHAPLAMAAASGEPVLALYIVEPGLWQQPDSSSRQWAFLRECLEDLDAGLRQRGNRLVVMTGEAVDVLARLHRLRPITALHAHEETGTLWTYARDKAVARWARQASVPFLETQHFGVWRRLSSRDGWAARWDRMMGTPCMAAPDHLPAPDLPSEDWPDAAALGLAPDPCPARQRGGRQEARALLRSFLYERGRDYRRAMSSPAGGAEACSRISAHLAFGCLSMRETYQAARRAQAYWRGMDDAVYAASLQSFISRLHWHCHFIQKLEDAPDLERRPLHPAYAGLRPLGPDHETITTAWIEGRTGFPFVDACMASLRAMGWLNFRMRSMVMAFSSYHLWQDWRLPARRLARRFTDFEPGIHYPQAQMQSGVTGVNTARIYNPVKQSHDQDPDGAFIRHWLPALAALPNALIHEPWLAPPERLAQYGVVLGQTYPERLVDHVAAAAQARTAIYALRKGRGYRDAADAIQHRHGSRKSGLASTEGRKRKVPVRKAPPHPEFDFG